MTWCAVYAVQVQITVLASESYGLLQKEHDFH